MDWTPALRPAADGEGVPLFRTENGTAVRCSCCDRLEVCLGNAVFCLNAADLDELRNVVGAFAAEPAREGDDARRSCVIRVEDDAYAFAFRHAEILELATLLDGARERLRARPLPGFALRAAQHAPVWN